MNGELEKYELTIRKLETMKDFIKERDFCNERKSLNFNLLFRVIKIATYATILAVDIAELSQEIHNNFVQNLTSETEDNEEIDEFESELQNFIYVKRRSKRSDEASEEAPPKEDLNLLRLETEETENNEFNFASLDHLSSYAITVRACRKESNNATDGLCGPESQIVAKTLENTTADDINVFEVHLLQSNTSENEVKLLWDPPTNPNGFILNYDVKQVRIDDKTSRPEFICISLVKRSNISSQIIDRLAPGNYSIQISAVTLAGQGNYTSPRYIYIPSASHFSLIASPTLTIVLFVILASVAAALVFAVHKRKQPPENVNRLENFESEDHPFDH